MNETIRRLRDVLRESDNAVFFGGAGVSTESGIPDFRSADELYHKQYAYPPETMLSHSFFFSHTEEFFRFYREKMIYPGASPNKAHTALATLERQGKLKAVITQVIRNAEVLVVGGTSLNVYPAAGLVRYYRGNKLILINKSETPYDMIG